MWRFKRQERIATGALLKGKQEVNDPMFSARASRKIARSYSLRRITAYFSGQAHSESVMRVDHVAKSVVIFLDWSGVDLSLNPLHLASKLFNFKSSLKL